MVPNERNMGLQIDLYHYPSSCNICLNDIIEEVFNSTVDHCNSICLNFAAFMLWTLLRDFICVNFTRLEIQRAELSTEELIRLVRRKDLHCKTDALLACINTWADLHTIGERQRRDVLRLARRVTRKPATILLCVGGGDGNYVENRVKVFNSFSNNWVVPTFQLPIVIACHDIQLLNEKLYILGGVTRDNRGNISTLSKYIHHPQPCYISNLRQPLLPGPQQPGMEGALRHVKQSAITWPPQSSTPGVFKLW